MIICLMKMSVLEDYFILTDIGPTDRDSGPAKPRNVPQIFSTSTIAWME